MRRTLACVVSGMALFTAGSAVLAAPERSYSGQDYPGRPTQAKVWVQNQGRGEALPVTIEDVTLNTPLRVQVIDTATVMMSPASITQSRHVRQAWEYRVVNVLSSDQGLLRGELTNAGADGWETTGHQFPIPGGTALLLKRPAERR